MAESVAESAVSLINQVGIFDVIIPFILGFAITFGMLEKTQILGKIHNLNALIAVCIGLAAALSF